jgi:alpha-tubulin suppressor-like RCC1 family protein
MNFSQRFFKTNFCRVVIDVSAGWRHSVIITSNNDVYTTGLNTFGQL